MSTNIYLIGCSPANALPLLLCGSDLGGTRKESSPLLSPFGQDSREGQGERGKELVITHQYALSRNISIDQERFLLTSYANIMRKEREEENSLCPSLFHTLSLSLSLSRVNIIRNFRIGSFCQDLDNDKKLIMHIKCMFILII